MAGRSPRGPITPTFGFDARQFDVAVMLSLKLALGFIRFMCEITEEFKEIRRLTNEKAILGEGIDSPHRNGFCGGRSNDGAHRELFAEKYCRLRHDQVGLQGLRLR